LKNLEAGNQSRQAEDRGEHKNTTLKESPFNYATSYWLKHAMDVPSGMNSTPLSKALWELVRDFFWENTSTTFFEWLRVFPDDTGEWHLVSDTGGSYCGRCLFSDRISVVTSGLHIAASYGLPDILDWAHPDGLDFEIRCRKGRTPLMYAALVGELDAAEVLLSKDCVHVNLAACEDPNCTGQCELIDGTALQRAAYGRRLEVMKILLKQPSIEVDQIFHGTTALGMSINENDQDGIKLLVEAGAELAMYKGETLTIRSSS
jgi:hypothetical protein